VTRATDRRLTQYLLGDLSDTEQASLEREFFSDRTLFDRLVRTETDLVDDYVARRLSWRRRRRFERHYMADANRRQRVEFARSLATKIGGVQPAGGSSVSTWRMPSMLPPGAAGRLAIAAGLVLITGLVGWLAVQNGRLRRDLARTETARQLGTDHERELQQQLAKARSETATLTDALERVRTRAPADHPAAPPPARSFVSLVLNVRGVRSPQTGDAPMLRIPPGTTEVRVELALQESEYAAYRVSVKPIGGTDVFTREHVAARKAPSGPRVTIAVPADRLPAGDYVLTLSGERANATQDVSQSLFHIDRQ